MLRASLEFTAPGAPRPRPLGAVEIWDTGEGLKSYPHYAAHVRDAMGFAGRHANVGLLRRSGHGWDLVARALRSLGFNVLESAPGPVPAGFVRAAERLRAAVNSVHKVQELARAAAEYDEAAAALHETLAHGRITD